MLKKRILRTTKCSLLIFISITISNCQNRTKTNYGNGFISNIATNKIFSTEKETITNMAYLESEFISEPIKVDLNKVFHDEKYNAEEKPSLTKLRLSKLNDKTGKGRIIRLKKKTDGMYYAETKLKEKFKKIYFASVGIEPIHRAPVLNMRVEF